METVKKQLLKHLDGGEAFMPVSHMLNKISFDSINIRPAGLPYSFYQLFYHIVYTQKDIVKFVCSEDYIKPKWPDYYWPKDKNCKNPEQWENLKAEYFTDKERLKNFVLDDAHLLDAVVKNGKDDQTLIREILLVLEHTAYHTGQLLIVLRLLNLH
ncbi:MAG: DinB family protein [Bacteroidetes bacterium]|jgi:uncharacterized damage-inducible protein DinB|nr:DinB family protein [Bacteroidota bacterium]